MRARVRDARHQLPDAQEALREQAVAAVTPPGRSTAEGCRLLGRRRPALSPWLTLGACGDLSLVSHRDPLSAASHACHRRRNERSHPTLVFVSPSGMMAPHATIHGDQSRRPVDPPGLPRPGRRLRRHVTVKPASRMTR
jgi:transposase-like protein